EVRTLIDHAVENNPFQKQQEQSYQSAKLQTKIAKSNYYPRLTAFFDYSRRVPEFDLIFKNLENEFTWFAGLSLRWNLFNGFADKINVEQAKIQEKIAREQMVDSRRNLISNVKSLYDNLQALREIIEINKTNLESAREEYRLAQERYNVGSGTALELRDAQVRLTNAEQILVATEYNAAITYARLQQAIGKLGSNYGGNESDMN
ncbi:MAG: TolC family protein, partial [Calditrichae bacterium]|nr:TolC family protein [Calditrichia bacterium]NIW78007.1 TolC family protein [Calditrichia bacterium]